MAQSHWRRVMSWCVSFEENYAMAHREEEEEDKDLKMLLALWF